MVDWWVWILVAAVALIVSWRLRVIRFHQSRRGGEFSSRVIIRGKPVAGLNFHREDSARRELHIHVGKRRVNIYPRRKRRVRKRRRRKS